MKLFLTLNIVVFSLFVTAGLFSATDSTTLNSTNITSNVTLNSNTAYIMKGYNYVKNGATLIIEPGTKILGDYNTKGTLVIERGGKIYANGNSGNPIVFSSRRPAGQRATGDWGGIIILGRSGINTVNGTDSAEIEGFGPGLGPIYGGQPRLDDDSSGVFRYVRIEFGGVNLTGVSGNEINSLTMGGVGSRTVIEYIQVSFAGDDSYEWFGGTVNCKYLISYKALDDDFDSDNGFRGKVQFCLGVRDTSFVDVSTSNGIETDNNANSPSNFNSPRTKPIFSNVTLIGPFAQSGWSLNPLWGRGEHLRRNTQTSTYNSVIMGWRVGVRFDGSGVGNAAQGDTIQLRNNIFGGNLRLADSTGTGSFAPQQWLQNASYGNSVYSDNSSVMLTNPFNIYPDIPLPANNINYWMPMGGSPALTGASFSNPNLSGFENVSFRGAFGTTNWTSGWTQFNPKNYEIIGIRQITNLVPEAYALNQNYPNPFNPSTKINFSIPEKGFVSLKVFDVNGREISELVNQNISEGAYEYTFDASGLTSGIYFYTLKVNDFTETKRMLFLK